MDNADIEANGPAIMYKNASQELATETMSKLHDDHGLEYSSPAFVKFAESRGLIKHQPQFWNIRYNAHKWTDLRRDAVIHLQKDNENSVPVTINTSLDMFNISGYLAHIFIQDLESKNELNGEKVTIILYLYIPSYIIN